MEIQKIRLVNLHKLLGERFGGKKSKFAEAIGKDNNQVRFILYPEKPGGRLLGERQARKIEYDLGLEYGWLDNEHDNTIEDDGSFKRLMSVLKENAMTQTELANRLDLDGPQVVNNWKRRGIPRGMVIDIGSVLGVNPKWLIDGIDNKHGENPITADEIALLAIFRDLTTSNRQLVLNMAKALIEKS